MQHAKRFTAIAYRLAAGVAAAAFVMLASLNLASAQAAKGEPYKIGVTYPLSGPQGAWGQLLVPAMEIARRRCQCRGRRQRPALEARRRGQQGQSRRRHDGDAQGRAGRRRAGHPDHLHQRGERADAARRPAQGSDPVARSRRPAWSRTANGPSRIPRRPTRTLPLVFAYWKDHNVKRLFAFFPNTPIQKFLSPMVKTEAANNLHIEHDEALFKLGRYRLPRHHRARQGLQSRRDPDLRPWDARRRRHHEADPRARDESRSSIPAARALRSRAIGKQRARRPRGSSSPASNTTRLMRKNSSTSTRQTRLRSRLWRGSRTTTWSS